MNLKVGQLLDDLKMNDVERKKQFHTTKRKKETETEGTTAYELTGPLSSLQLHTAKWPLVSYQPKHPRVMLPNFQKVSSYV